MISTTLILKKSRKANLEKRRILFFLIGLVFSGSLVFAAFEWKSYDDDYDLDEASKLPIPDETVEFTPPGVRPRIQTISAVPKIVVVHIPVLPPKLEKLPDIVPEPLPPKAEPSPVNAAGSTKSGSSMLVKVDELPQFPGGETALYDFLSKNSKYPILALGNGIMGNVLAAFVVGSNGQVSNVKIVSGIGAGTEEEVLRILKLMPNWKPGKVKGENSPFLYYLPVLFLIKK